MADEAQAPGWPRDEVLRAVTDELRTMPPLVLPAECDRLTDRLAAVAAGEAFLLQGGDCAETFAAPATNAVLGKLQTLLQMAVVLTYAAQVPVVKVGRIAGQYAKPRSRPTETRDGVELPAYRGDAVNGAEFTADARRPDPRRMLTAYQRSAATLNLCRAYTTSGYAGVREAHAWNQDFVRHSAAGRRYERLTADIDRALAFTDACGTRPEELNAVEFYSSHEALLLDYERALTTVDGYDLSAHLLWIGERTRALDGEHVAFARSIRNPVAVKLGPSVTPDEVLALIDVLDADRRPGRLTLVSRMGAGAVRELLPPIVEKVSASGAQVVWACDPMHGNTFATPNGYKSRRFDDVLDELTGFFEVHAELGTHPGGIHVELTGDDVTECVGGGSTPVTESDLHRRYETACDPRLNRGQSIELAFRIAEMYRSQPSPSSGVPPCDDEIS